jgi:hypothetical protein
LLNGGNYQEIPLEYHSNGFIYEAREVMHCIDSGLTESPKLKLEFSLRLMKLMDAIRTQIGLTFPEEIEKY